ncbi:Bifunctional dethiobiotin synthetase/7,8-diamino-pelargonic acid aminotransferase [Fusarium oxysporum f. sp. albedinis]|nr:Bifunctional dethiobiotin synthetase/7,8-diamino-pelargonic acid aminotransferase [Fusarium oxysporum f. sp. albedinis]
MAFEFLQTESKEVAVSDDHNKQGDRYNWSPGTTTAQYEKILSTRNDLHMEGSFSAFAQAGPAAETTQFRAAAPAWWP